MSKRRRAHLQCFVVVGWAAGRASGLYKTEWWGAGTVICLGRGADFHMAQLMSLSLAPGNPDCFWFNLSGTGSPG